MHNTLKFIFSFAIISVLILGLIASFNYYVDPMCYYHCDGIDLSIPSQNVYYQASQIVEANPEAEILILGSSRGENIPPQWIEKRMGLKTINLSKGGAGIMLKVSLLRLALAKGLPVKKVIWIADYFELAGKFTDVKVRQTPVLRNQIKEEVPETQGLKNSLEFAQRLVDHNTFEASVRQLAKKDEDRFSKTGSGSKHDESACEKESYHGSTQESALAKEIIISYSTFLKFLLEDLNKDFVDVFEKELKKHSDDGIQFYIVVPPYHPTMMAKVHASFPLADQKHQEWLQLLQKQESKNIFFTSFWDGIPDDKANTSYWDDGAHPTCRSMILMLNKALPDRHY